MRMTVVLLALCSTWSSAQQETFDVVAFKAPAGWTREATPAAIGFKRINPEARTWAQLAVYRSVESKGSIERDAVSEWEDIVRKPHPDASKPKVSDRPAIGEWKVKLASGQFGFEGASVSTTLVTFSNGRRAASVLATSISSEFTGDMTKFLGSLTAAGAAEASPPATPVASNYQFSSTTFEDGWVASEAREGVLLKKGSSAVLLHFPVEYTDATRNLDDQPRVLHFWNTLVSPRHRVPTVNVKKSEGYDRVYFGEGDGTDSSGGPVHVALLITSENGFARCIELVTPDAASFGQQFPNFERIRAMSNANKFNVGARDLTGTWANSSANYGQYVNAITGDSAGMRGVSKSESFVFRADGTYAYKLVAASGQIGAQQIGKENKQGKFSVGNWELTTRDSDGVTSVYSAQFEVVRGGRVLHLQHKQLSGMSFHLVRRP